jgi:multidomain signaling protein FimX
MSLDFHQQLEQLRQKFVASLPERGQRLEEIWSHLRHLNWSQQGINVLQHFAHKLAENSTHYGFPELQLSAAQLDELLISLSNLERRIGGQEHAQLEDHVAQLSKIMLLTASGSGRKDPLAQAPNTAAYSQTSGKNIFLIDPDHIFAAFCSAYLREAGFTVEYFDNPQSCMQRLYLDSPAIVLMDPDFERSGLEAMGNLHQIKALLTQNTPVILMSGRTDVNAKLRALRAGSSDYLVKPFDINFLIEKLLASINQHTQIYRIMIVDDDPAMLDLEAEILRYAGMEVLCVNQPLHSLQRAAKFKPDLVILDMHMPDINGIELAILLRQDPDFLLLPIIFITADTDANLHKSIKALGINALLTKPFEATDLINMSTQALADTSALKNRVARVTRQSHQANRVNHSYFFSVLEGELHKHSLGGQTSALYYFSTHELTDVTQQLGQIELINLHEQFCQRLSDIIGSDEHWMGLSNMVACVLVGKRSAEFHRQRADQFTKYLSSQSYSIKGKQLSLHIEAGIAILTPTLGTANNALLIAEQMFEQTLAATPVPPPETTKATPVLSESASTSQLPDIAKIDFSRDLSLAFQPIISLEDAHIDHFSVLTRLHTSDGNPIPASQFLNRITQPGRRLELDRWVLQQAVSAIAGNSETREQATLFIHLAEETLQQSTFFSFAANVLRSSRLRGEERLVFMLEEQWVLNHFHQAREISNALRDIRCGVCITRAGENEEILKILDKLAVNFLRLSPNLTGENNNPKLLERLIHSATGRNIHVIATQIEHSHNLSSLWVQGVRLFEGFFIQPPDTGFRLKNDIIFAKEFVQENGFNGS